ncbi:MAG: TetR/AcrR family transcriptional regulator C-terminal domain-containing protein [Lacisediminihabitans sp.]
MTSPRRLRLNREMIAEAALSISSHSPGQDAVRVSGATLGNVLGVDRSAVWRHFSDKEDLIATCGDLLFVSVVEAAGRDADPWARLVATFHAIVESFRAHPFLAIDAMSVPLSGSNWRLLAEITVTALGDLGLSPEAAARYFRVFAEVTTSFAATLAHYEERPDVQRAAGLRRTQAELLSLNEADFPQLAAAGPLIATITQDQVATLIVGAFRVLLNEAQTTTGWPITLDNQVSPTNSQEVS